MAGNKQGGKGKSKNETPSRKRYHANNQREANKKRRMAKHGAPGSSRYESAWRAACEKRADKRDRDPRVIHIRSVIMDNAEALQQYKVDLGQV